MITAAELETLLKVCKQSGVTKLKSGDLEIDIKPPPDSHEPVMAQEAFPSWDTLTPEQKLLWSATPDLPTS
jgi:hypothetical protein